MRDRSIRKWADWNQFDTEFATNLILFIQIPAVKHVNNVNFCLDIVERNYMLIL